MIRAKTSEIATQSNSPCIAPEHALESGLADCYESTMPCRRGNICENVSLLKKEKTRGGTVRHADEYVIIVGALQAHAAVPALNRDVGGQINIFSADDVGVLQLAHEQDLPVSQMVTC
jgi:hypothetical protein